MPSRQLIEKTRLLTETPLAPDASVEDYCESYDGFGDLFPSDSTVAISDASMGGVEAHLLEAAQVDNDRTVLFFHGGGYVIGSLKSHEMIVTRLASWANCRVWFPVYRLAPEHLFPAAIDDCMRSWEWLLSTGVDPKKVAFAGDSAGGGLVYAVMLRAKQEGLALPACGWSICPWSDMEGHGTWREGEDGRDPLLSAAELEYFVDTYLQGENLRHPWVAPMYGDLASLPPSLIQAGGVEIPLEDARTLANNLRAAGSEVILEEQEGAGHVWHHMVPDVPEANASIEQGVQFITRHTS